MQYNVTWFALVWRDLCYLPPIKIVVQFDNEKCYLLNYDLFMSTPTTTLNLPLQYCKNSNYVLYSR